MMLRRSAVLAKGHVLGIHRVRPEPLELVHAASVNDVPRLHHGLEQVMRDNYIHPLKSRETTPHEYFYPPELELIMPPHRVDHRAFRQFKRPSEDGRLMNIASKHRTKYISSTSQCSGLLTHLMRQLTNFKRPTVKPFIPSSNARPDYGAGVKKPSLHFLRPLQNGAFALDAAASLKTSPTFLAGLGHSLEYVFTQPDISKSVKTLHDPMQYPNESHEHEDLSFSYSKLSSLLVRSQLDAFVPHYGVVDIKTRATVNIRQGGSTIDKHYSLAFAGERSYEREQLDMIRLAFPKYALQCQFGAMKGIFVAYHNGHSLQGFQSIPLDTMQESVMQNRGTWIQTFEASGAVLCRVLDQIIDIQGDTEPIRFVAYADDQRRCVDFMFHAASKEDPCYKNPRAPYDDILHPQKVIGDGVIHHLIVELVAEHRGQVLLCPWTISHSAYFDTVVRTTYSNSLLNPDLLPYFTGCLESSFFDRDDLSMGDEDWDTYAPRLGVRLGDRE